MIRIQLAIFLLLGTALAHADGEIDKYLGEYTAATVCDSHKTTPSVEPHVQQDGKFIIAKFIDSDGEEKAVVVGDPEFSEYDWNGIHFTYVPGKEFDGIDLQCPDAPDRSLRANLEARRYVLNGRTLTADEIVNLSATLEAESSEDGDVPGPSGFEHLRAEHDFHGAGNAHIIKIYKYGCDKLFMEYQASEGGIHAGHIHN